MELHTLIRNLPLVLQVLIGEFNAHHRGQTKQIHTQFHDTIYQPCRVCESPYYRENFYSVDYFLFRKYRLYERKCVWCSETCFSRDTDQVLKDYYQTSINQYLKKDSISHRGEEVMF